MSATAKLACSCYGMIMVRLYSIMRSRLVNLIMMLLLKGFHAMIEAET
jgi:hypothetical protein